MSAGQLTLYIDLEKGRKADLEAVARASLAYADAVREIAAFLDPFSDTRIDLLSTTEASLSLNTKISFKIAGRTYETTLRAVIIVLGLYLVTHAGDVVTEKGINYMWDGVFGEASAPISKEDKDEIVKRVTDTVQAKAGERQIRQIYAELDQDPSVLGVGICRNPGERPHYIVPKSEFSRLSGVTKLEEPPEKIRICREIVNVILVSPVLENDRKRKWRFKILDREFGAPIRDHTFLDAVFSGKHPLILKGNISMRVAMEWQEDFVEGAWIPSKFVVWNVLSVPGQYQGQQELLPFDQGPKTRRKTKRRR